MQLPSTTSGLVQTIQLSIAPVFLLSAVGVYLGVLANRLARIVDRTRVLETSTLEAQQGETVARERVQLGYRRRLILQAINLCTFTAVLIAAIIAALFMGAFIGVDLTRLVGWAFITAMCSLIVGLINFLREVQLALQWVRSGGSPRASLRWRGRRGTR